MSDKIFPPGVAETFAEHLTADAAPAAPIVRFIGDRARSTTIALDWPVEYDGREYREVVLRRLTAKEVADFMARIAAMPDDAKITWPVFRDATTDAELPEAVFSALDADDSMRLNEAAVAFLPRRYGGDPASATIPATGAPTEP